jgi:hypothetical protein
MNTADNDTNACSDERHNDYNDEEENDADDDNNHYGTCSKDNDDNDCDDKAGKVLTIVAWVLLPIFV